MTEFKEKNLPTNSDSPKTEKMRNIAIGKCNVVSRNRIACLIKAIEETKKSEYVVGKGDTLYRIFEDHFKNEDGAYCFK
jgi:hypothetical protein